jgi:hypothetical protein
LYWSSSAVGDYVAVRWYVHFYDGRVGAALVEDDNDVRCVR